MSNYKVTGVLTNGKRFPAIYTDNLNYALMINLYRGTVWRKDDQGKWRKIREVWN